MGCHIPLAIKGSSQCPRFYNAVRKYGPESFHVRFLSQGLSREQAILDEMLLIYLLEPEYNISEGGVGPLGFSHSSETKEKIRQAHLGRRRAPEIGAKQSKRQTGVPRSVEMRKRLSDTKKKKLQDKREQALRLRGSGLSQKHIGVLLGVSQSAVSVWFKEQNGKHE